MTSNSDIWLILVISWLVSAFIGALIGGTKGKAGAGFWCGFFLGPIGWIIAALLQPTTEVEAARQGAVQAAMRPVNATPIAYRATEPCPSCGRMVGENQNFCAFCAAPLARSCPWCAEKIKSAAIVCRHCGRDIPTVASG
jgi:hypothetical protein